MSSISRKEHKSKHKRHDESSDRHHNKRHKSDDKDENHRHKKHKHRHRDKPTNGIVTIDDDEEGDMWVEMKPDGDGQQAAAVANIPTAKSLELKMKDGPWDENAPLAPTPPTVSSLKRDEWMLDPITSSQPTVPSDSVKPKSAKLETPEDDGPLTEGYGEEVRDKRTLGGGIDWFSSLGTERKKKQVEKPDPEKLRISSRELNTQLKEGKSVDEYTSAPAKPVTPGGPGSQWRMLKLKRCYETAEEEGRSIEDVAIERYGNLEAFEEAKEERRWLDEKDGKRSSRGDGKTPMEKGRGRDEGQKGYMFTDLGPDSRPSSRNSFRRPNASDTSTPSTPRPGPSTSAATPEPLTNKRLDALRGGPRNPQFSSPLGPSTPIPTVMTPTTLRPTRRALSPSSLNKLQARVLRAKLMDQPDAGALEKQYNEELQRANAENTTESPSVEVLPTLDGHGRLYDVGQGKDDGKVLPGNKRKKTKVETRDPKTGDVVRYNADDDETTLGEMLRQEKFGAGMSDQKSLDAELAGAIATDAKFQDDLEYMDDNADKLGRKKMRTDAMKRQFAINDYARTKKALASCQHCYGEDDEPPKAAIIAMGTRAYLSCTLNDELVEGHCHIVPIQHHLSMLEGDDDLWDEVRNFMKCLMKMFAEEDQGVVFYETVLNLRWQKHTFIECVPIPWALFNDIPAYFKESILASESEWSQHKKLIDFSARPGGFRRAMVPNLPYFMVQWDYKGEKGYGHVIEGVGDAAGGGEGDGAVDEGDKGGGDFPRYFAAEIIGNTMDIEPRRWRRPKKIGQHHNQERTQKFMKKYKKFDWTHLIEKS